MVRNGGDPYLTLDRVVAVIASFSDGPEQVGSGYLVDGRLVLTAAHCTRNKATGAAALRLRVVRPRDAAESAVVETIVDYELDVAALRLGSAPWGLSMRKPVFARVDRTRAGVLEDCQAIGFPLYQRDPSRGVRATSELHGTIYQTDEAESGRLLMREPMVHPGPLNRSDADGRMAQSPSASPWEGFSGALVFHRERAIGVIVEHHPRQGDSALRAVTFDRLAERATRDDPTNTARKVAEALHLLSYDSLPLVEAEPADKARSADGLDEVVDRLAQAVRNQWEQEERHRKVTDPVELPVRWRSANYQLADYWENIQRRPIGCAAAAPLDLAGQLEQIADVYRLIPSGRLVILGTAGAGKTILAARLVLDLLKVRAAGGPVPVLVSVGSWNPSHHTLQQWLVDQLGRNYPGLALAFRGSNLAETLLDAGRIVPILDGFDEISEGLRRPALQRLNTIADLPLVLTSRSQEFTTAVDVDVLTAAAVIELEDLTVDDLAQYLPRTTRRRTEDKSGGLWDPILGHLRNNDAAAARLKEVLSNRLMVYLARTIYSDIPGRDPTELLDTHRFPNLEDLEKHLLGGYIPAVYQDPAAGRRWGVDCARQGLGYLAQHVNQLDTPDLAWWQIRDTIPLRSRVLGAWLIIGLPFGLLSGFVLGLGFELLLQGEAHSRSAGLVVGLMGGANVALTFGLKPTGPPLARIHFRIGGRNARLLVLYLALGIAAGLAYGLAIAFRAGATSFPRLLTLALPLGLLGGVFIWLARGLEAPIDITTTPSPVRALRADRNNAIRKIGVMWLGGIVGFAILGGLVDKFEAGLALGLGFGLLAALNWDGMQGAWAHWLVFVRIWLPLTGRLPWAVHAFLVDAYQRGVLRQTGAAYQFRHASLKNELTPS